MQDYFVELGFLDLLFDVDVGIISVCLYDDGY
jgi:hypothetical protein